MSHNEVPQMRCPLNGCEWEVKGFWPGEPLWTKSVESTVDRKGVTPWLRASVPGGVHKALQRAGIIPDPYYELNSLLCEWVEHRWWVFRTGFTAPNSMKGMRVELRLEGLDDRSHILLNNKLLGFHEGMFEPAVFEVTDILSFDRENHLLVVFECPQAEQGQIGWTSKTFTQKARFNYKWDFCARLVNIGIWQEVSLRAWCGAKLENISLTGDYRAGRGWLDITACAEGQFDTFRVEADLSGETVFIQSFSADPSGSGCSVRIPIDQPALWWPNGMGDQPLYCVKLSLLKDSLVCDTWEGRAGIRSLSFRRCEGAPLDALPYLPVINGKPVYIKGLNLTPLDLCYGDVSKQRYTQIFAALRHMNANLVRVWGGGLIETEVFYQLADEMGILVWQEFIQSSSGIENVPSHDPAYLQILAKNAAAAIITKRNHVSLTFWSGGNELTGEDGLPVTARDPNIRLLGSMCRELDPGRLFLPSSPSGPSFGVTEGTPAKSHDVHGNWQYEGITRHYQKYNLSDSMLQSEFGTDGISALASLRAFLGEENLHITAMKDNAVWRHHGEWWDTLNYRDKPLFGDAFSMGQWVMISQLMQAESLRYIVQSNRRRQFFNCGSIIWQMNEPFPNASCTSLTSYDGRQKHAYYAVRQAYAKYDVSLVYDSLIHLPGSTKRVMAFAHASVDGRANCQVRLELLDIYGHIHFKVEEQCDLADKMSYQALACSIPYSPMSHSLYFVRLRLLIQEETIAEQLYFFTQRKEHEAPLSPMLHLPPATVQVKRTSEGYVAKNTGDTVCLFLHAQGEKPAALMNQNFITLFPGDTTAFIPIEAHSTWQFTALNEVFIEST